MEFLPESAGNIIITPPEYIVKTGSDFDIDKSNLIFPSIRKDGSLYDSKTKARNINQIFADINAITSDISEYSRMQNEIANFNRQFTKDLKQLDKFEETLMQVILLIYLKLIKIILIGYIIDQMVYLTRLLIIIKKKLN